MNSKMQQLKQLNTTSKFGEQAGIRFNRLISQEKFL